MLHTLKFKSAKIKSNIHPFASAKKNYRLCQTEENYDILTFINFIDNREEKVSELQSNNSRIICSQRKCVRGEITRSPTQSQSIMYLPKLPKRKVLIRR